jgi:hypothetical protein
VEEPLGVPRCLLHAEGLAGGKTLSVALLFQQEIVSSNTGRKITHRSGAGVMYQSSNTEAKSKL